VRGTVLLSDTRLYPRRGGALHNLLRSLSVRRRSMKRVGCTLEVKPELVDEYNAIHASIWLNMLDALRRHR